MTKHGALSIVANIKPGRKQQLTEMCKEIEAGDVETNPIIPFRKITSIHFARFVVFDESTDAFGNDVGARFVFTTNYDQPYERHLEELVTVAGPGLWKLFSLCEDFPENELYNKETLIKYIKSNTVSNAVFYVGVGYRSVLQIKQENELREEIENFIDQNQASLKNKGPVQIREKIIDFVNNNPSLSWSKKPVEKPSLAWKIGFYGKMVLFIILAIVLLPVIIPFVIIWLILILITEMKEKDITFDLDKKHIRELVERETGLVQAQFSAMGNIKPGWIRQQTMMFLLHLTNFLAPYLFSKGKLSGIPTVHFARWIIVNEGRQMIFLSNFDGNSESYLRDFINIAGKQLSLMFCHTVGYPKTRLMVIGGADDANGFMRWARKFQTITNVWYTANKEVSVKNIFNNSKIRDGLYGTMTGKEAAHWLSLL
ncbi:MAG: peroxidase [Segetibacter sp.]|nr:peroxidase [Segetibacter sp.]